MRNRAVASGLSLVMVVVSTPLFAVQRGGRSGTQPPVIITGPGGVRGAPESGIWSFRMDIPAGTLSGVKCPAGPFARPSAGEGRVVTSQFGQVVRFFLDGQTLTFFRTSGGGSVASYATNDRTFPVVRPVGPSTPGTVSFEFTTEESRRALSGFLTWDNRVGCTGRYPFAMEWLRELPDVPPPPRPRPGIWVVTIRATTDNTCQTMSPEFVTQFPLRLTLSAVPDPASGDISGDYIVAGWPGFPPATPMELTGLGQVPGGLSYLGTVSSGPMTDPSVAGWLDIRTTSTTHMEGELGHRVIRSTGFCEVRLQVSLDYTDGRP